MFLPFGKSIVEDPDAGSTLNAILNVIWIVGWGWALALNHLVFAALLAITIVGLPFAKQHLKLMMLSLFPFGRRMLPLKLHGRIVPRLDGHHWVVAGGW